MMQEITSEWITYVGQRLSQGKGIRRKLAGNGAVRIDRPLPFLCVYRYPPAGGDPWTANLVRTEAAYVIVSNESSEPLSALVREVAGILSDEFNAFLLLEIWAAPSSTSENGTPLPTFRIVGHPASDSAVTESFRKALEKIRIPYALTTVAVQADRPAHPPFAAPLLPAEEAEKMGCVSLGLEVSPFYLNPDTGQPYPVTLRLLMRRLSRALQRTFFEFMRLQSNHAVTDFRMLGPSTLRRTVWNIDRRLAEINNSFQFLLLVTPVNANEAWEEFRQSRFEKAPAFHYRLLPVDPDALKRKLYAIPIDQVDDPTLAHIFRDKRHEMDKMITLLADRNTPDFRLGSLQLFGGVPRKLRQLARDLLTQLPLKEDSDAINDTVSATEFAQFAQTEIAYLRAQSPDVRATIHIRDDFVGLMVSEGNLHIGRTLRTPRYRVEALIQHEVGTHILTYYNGKAQPLQQLYCGMPGYEALQEGLALLSEYLVGGLSAARMRLLAARVLAVDALIEGCDFIETFRMLTTEYGFAPSTAFTITMRVFRGGGLTKDAVYLRGLVELLAYLKKGNDLEPLLIGKIRQEYIPVIQELIYRNVLRPVPIRPRYLTDEHALAKLAQLKQGGSVFTLFSNENPAVMKG